MKPRLRERAWATILVIATAAVVSVLAVLQYRWSNQVSEATAVRLADSLEPNWMLRGSDANQRKSFAAVQLLKALKLDTASTDDIAYPVFKLPHPADPTKRLLGVFNDSTDGFPIA